MSSSLKSLLLFLQLQDRRFRTLFRIQGTIHVMPKWTLRELSIALLYNSFLCLKPVSRSKDQRTIEVRIMQAMVKAP